MRLPEEINPAVEGIVEETRRRMIPLTGDGDFDAIVQRARNARIVMLGEASHGTEEFYAWRRRISQRLITELGFNFIAVEGDWPDAQRINRFAVSGEGGTASQVLAGYNRWPTWMWANTEVIGLAEWMLQYNHNRPSRQKIGFHGLDIYSLFDSIDSVLKYLRKINPFLARQAQNRYSCFEPYNRDEIAYTRSLASYPQGCEAEVLANLHLLLEQRLDSTSAEGFNLLEAQQNARIVANAEHYYRAMFKGTSNTWNIRDRHMMDTLDLLLSHYGPRSKAIVWAHNTHVGDYRATDMVLDGSINIGGLARERHGLEATMLVGFGTYRGTVIASHAWDGPTELMDVPPGRQGSYEDAFHRASMQDKLSDYVLIMNENDVHGPLGEIHGHRAIGVVYDPHHEHWGNYVPTSLARRYDAFVFLDQTQGLTPLNAPFNPGQLPETWPVGQ